MKLFFLLFGFWSCQTASQKDQMSLFRQSFSEPFFDSTQKISSSSPMTQKQEESLESPFLQGQFLEPFTCWDSVYYQSWENWQNDLWSKKFEKRTPRKKRSIRQRFYREEKLADELKQLIAQQQYDFPIVIERNTVQWVKFFLNKGKRDFVTWLRRAEDMKDIIKPILKSYGLPEDLIYLSMIESGFQTRALSHASALGPWQFIESTGKLYGLQTDHLYDERLDLVKSTHAACRFFLDLYKEFQNWHLAVSGYNAGQRRITRAIRRGKQRDFFILANKGYLPRETRQYVPKLQAAMILSKNATAFGFDRMEGVFYPETTTLVVNRSISLDALAREAGISPLLLKNLNPALKLGLTPLPSEHANFQLQVPKKYEHKVAKALERVPKGSLSVILDLKPKRSQRLDQIAQRTGLMMQDLLKLNPQYRRKSWIRRNKRIRLQVNLGDRRSKKVLKHFRQ